MKRIQEESVFGGNNEHGKNFYSEVINEEFNTSQ